MSHIYIFFSCQILNNSCPSAKDVLGHRHNTAVPFVCSETPTCNAQLQSEKTKNKEKQQRQSAEALKTYCSGLHNLVNCVLIASNHLEGEAQTNKQTNKEEEEGEERRERTHRCEGIESLVRL